jgi:hypothetical protein
MSLVLFKTKSSYQIIMSLFSEQFTNPSVSLKTVCRKGFIKIDNDEFYSILLPYNKRFSRG